AIRTWPGRPSPYTINHRLKSQILNDREIKRGEWNRAGFNQTETTNASPIFPPQNIRTLNLTNQIGTLSGPLVSTCRVCRDSYSSNRTLENELFLGVVINRVS